MPNSKIKPPLMEDLFSPGFKHHPLIHMGSQSLSAWHNSVEEQAHEGFHLVAVHGDDVGIARDVDPDYIDYWNKLTGGKIISLSGLDSGSYLSQAILSSPEVQEQIKGHVKDKSTLLLPFLVTDFEEQVGEALGIPLYGSVAISNKYGTKAGIRELAAEIGVTMSPGFVCRNLDEIEKAILDLSKKFTHVAVKHTLSASGYMSRKLPTDSVKDLKKHIDELSGREFKEGEDVFVVEGWVKNNASLCAQIEISPGHKPVISAGWQQIIDSDGITYMGAGPLQLSPKALESFMDGVKKLADGLYKNGAIGVFGPDFIVVSPDEKNLESDTALLVELNARVPATALPLEAVLRIRGKIGNNFCSTSIEALRSYKFKDIAEKLKIAGLLITQKGPDVRGVVPFNVGMLPHGSFDIIAMGSDFDDTMQIVRQVKEMFK